MMIGKKDTEGSDHNMFEVLSQYLPRETEETNGNPQQEEPLSQSVSARINVLRCCSYDNQPVRWRYLMITYLTIGFHKGQRAIRFCKGLCTMELVIPVIWRNGGKPLSPQSR
jgi:hypothetical protein